MEFLSPAGAGRYRDLIAADRILVGLDFDGTLSPIVDDPTAARIHPAAGDALAALAERVRAVAIVTGRPAAQVLDLGALPALAARITGAGLVVLGQYGHERWTSAEPRVTSPPPPEALADFRAELTGLLDRLGLDPWLEEKGLAIAVHTRRMADPGGAFDVLLPALTEAAHRHGLHVEPGRSVIEVRAPGSDKGTAVRTLLAETAADGVVFVGDDLGDVAAFEAVAELRDGGMPGLLVCSGSAEQEALVELADVVVPGPDGVVAFLRELTDDLARR